MNSRIDAHVARTQFGQLMDRAVRKKERFVIDRRGEPAVVILSVQDFLETVPSAPKWLRRAWIEARRRGPERLAMERNDAQLDVTSEAKIATGARRG
ncbi:MAG TPA: type II toxin-antitoxin system Phd/YefM family antitoxin [Terracidiphilus sp.]|jgi:prevent-host-death family protein